MARRGLGLWCIVGFVGCSSGGGSSGGGGNGSQQAPAACATFCEQRQQAGCTTTEPIAVCQAECSEDASLEPMCSAQFAAIVNCATSAPMQCGPGGSPQITADCAQPAAAFDGCMSNNGWVSSGPFCSVYTCPGACTFSGCAECGEDTDCAPTQACVFNRCLERCLDDTDCPGSSCVSGECGDPVGKPCEGSLDCHGGSCTNVDANLTTVAGYCTMSCFGTECPGGYVCQDYECRRQ